MRTTDSVRVQSESVVPTTAPLLRGEPVLQEAPDGVHCFAGIETARAMKLDLAEGLRTKTGKGCYSDRRIL